MAMNIADILRRVVSIRSFSGEEGDRWDFFAEYLGSSGIVVKRIGNNLLAEIRCGGEHAPWVMLNSHLDTVKPAAGYTFDPFNPPFDPSINPAVVRGLGSNDAGGAVVSMVETAIHFHKHGGLDFNILLLLSAEEENSGPNGMRLVMREINKEIRETCIRDFEKTTFPGDVKKAKSTENIKDVSDIRNVEDIVCAIIGEPTQMKAAVAERGLLVLDGVATGVSGHAARNEGVNAIYIAMEDIERLRGYRFSKVSPLMGEVKVTVTQVNAGTQHNVVPDRCTFVVDIRPTDCYDNEEIYNELQGQIKSALTPRSLTNRSSATPQEHPLLKCVELLGIESYISPTTSDWMRIGAIPAVKMGPGDSARSHMADEYITVEELEGGKRGYIEFLKNLKLER